MNAPLQRPAPVADPNDLEPFRTMLRAVEALVLILNDQGVIEDCNETCEAVGGFPIRELAGRTFVHAFAAQGDEAAVLSCLEQVSAGGALEKAESMLLTKSGERRRIRWSGSRLGDPAEASSRLLLTGIDITREHEAVEELVKTQEVAGRLQSKLSVLSATYDLGDDPDADRRSERRRPFARRLRVAPLDDKTLPGEEAFVTVMSRDISARGLAFYVESPPAAQGFLIELGTGEHEFCLTASVQHVTLDQTSDVRRFLVGCKFTGRVESGRTRA